MAQGYTGYNIIDSRFSIKDGPNLDSFSRLRVSNPLTVFSNQFTYDKAPYIFEEVTNNLVQTNADYDSTNNLVSLKIAGVTPAGDYIYMQSYEHIPYQPGRSQLVFITFNFFPTASAGIGGAEPMVGLSDGNDGVELYWDAAANAATFTIKSTTGAGPQIIDQNNWNLDRLDGTGLSGINIDWTKTQILVIDFQALYVGRVRVGFDINGEIIYAHEFLHANYFNFPYFATANLPIRAGIVSVGTALATEMYFICCSVASEGGTEDYQRVGYNFVYTNNKTNLPGTSTYICSLSPALTFGPGGTINRTKFLIDSIEFLNVGTKAFKWSLGIGSTLTTPTYTTINAASAIQADTTAAAATALGLVIDSGYVASGTGAANRLSIDSISSRYPITLDAAGAKRPNGTLSLFAENIGGLTDFYYVIKWKEIR